MLCDARGAVVSRSVALPVGVLVPAWRGPGGSPVGRERRGSMVVPLAVAESGLPGLAGWAPAHCALWGAGSVAVTTGQPQAALMGCARPFRMHAVEVMSGSSVMPGHSGPARVPHRARAERHLEEPEAHGAQQRSKRHTAPPAASREAASQVPESSVPSAWHWHFELSPGDALLGGGAFAKVLRVLERSTGEAYAMKVMHRPNFALRGIGAQVDAEIKAMQRAARNRCRHVLRLADVVEENDYVYLRLELCACDLLRYASMLPGGRLGEAEAQKYTRQLMAGLSDLHSLGIIHRDLKPENLLLAADASLKLADFGWCADVRDAPTALAGTLQYMAPEMLEGRVQTEAVDMWSGAITVWQLLTSRPFLTTYLGPGASRVSHIDPHQSTSMRTRWLLDEISGKCPPMDDLRPEGVSDGCWHLLRGMLHPSARRRTSSTEALRHPWLEAPMHREEWPLVAPPWPNLAHAPQSRTMAPKVLAPVPNMISPTVTPLPAGTPVAWSPETPLGPTLPLVVVELGQAMGRCSALPAPREPQDKAGDASDASTTSGGSPRLSKAPSQASASESSLCAPPGLAAKHTVHRWRTSESKGELQEPEQRSPRCLVALAPRRPGNRRASIACPGELREQQRLLIAATAAARSATTAPEERRQAGPGWPASTARPAARPAGRSAGQWAAACRSAAPGLSRTLPARFQPGEPGEVVVLKAMQVQRPWPCPAGPRLAPHQPLAYGPLPPTRFAAPAPLPLMPAMSPRFCIGRAAA